MVCQHRQRFIAPATTHQFKVDGLRVLSAWFIAKGRENFFTCTARGRCEATFVTDEQRRSWKKDPRSDENSERSELFSNVLSLSILCRTKLAPPWQNRGWG
jgi:hypothetical protein